MVKRVIPFALLTLALAGCMNMTSTRARNNPLDPATPKPITIQMPAAATEIPVTTVEPVTERLVFATMTPAPALSTASVSQNVVVVDEMPTTQPTPSEPMAGNVSQAVGFDRDAQDAADVLKGLLIVFGILGATIFAIHKVRL